MTISSLNPWLSDFHTVQFSGICGLSYGLCKEAKCVCLCLYLGQKSLDHVNVHQFFVKFFLSINFGKIFQSFERVLEETFLKRFYLFILERKGGRKRGREKSMCGCLSHAPYWGPDLDCNPGMCPDWELNQQPFGSQAGAQSTEPHQPGLERNLDINIIILQNHLQLAIIRKLHIVLSMYLRRITFINKSFFHFLKYTQL